MHLHYSNITRIALGLIAAVAMAVTGMAADTAPPTIATVNGKTIQRADLDRELKLIKLKMARQGRPLSDAQLKRYTNEVRETLINRILLQEKATAEGVSVRAHQVKRALEQFKAGFKDAAAYHAALADMGFSEAMLTEQIKTGLVIKTLIDSAVIKGVAISDTAVRGYYDAHPELFHQPEQVRASHILINVTDNADEAKKAELMKTILNLKKRIAAGEDFAAVAREASECPSKARGGDLGFFSREQMVAPFSAAAFALEKGQVSDVVTTRFGYHLIKLTDKQAAKTAAFADVKNAIATRLRKEQEEKKIGNYLEKLKEGADIKRFPL
jgi:peptidyl-prolyl cis-trans isomerase C